MGMNLSDDDLLALRIFGVLNEYLHHTETLLVCGQHLEVIHDDIEDVSSIFLVKRFDNFLKHVLPVLVHGQSLNVLFFKQSFFDDGEFFCLRSHVDDVL